MVWSLGSWLLGVVRRTFSVLQASVCYIYLLFRNMAPPKPKAGQVLIGRWVNVILYSYIEECCSCDIKPYVIMTGVENLGETDNPEAVPPEEPTEAAQVSLHSKRHRCFIKAALGTRDRLMQETGTLMVVTSLLAGTALLLAAAANPEKAEDSEQASSTLNKAWQVLAILAFDCSMFQLAIGAMIGVFTVGHTPRTFMRFLFWGEFMAKSSLSCFLVSIVCLSAAALMYLYRLTDQGFGQSHRLGLVISLGAYGLVACVFASFLMMLQKEYEKWGCVVHKQALLSLEPFLSYCHKMQPGIAWDWERGKWPQLRAYMKMPSRKVSTFWYAVASVFYALGPLSILVGLPEVWWYRQLEKEQIKLVRDERERARVEERARLQPEYDEECARIHSANKERARRLQFEDEERARRLQFEDEERARRLQRENEEGTQGEGEPAHGEQPNGQPGAAEGSLSTSHGSSSGTRTAAAATGEVELSAVHVVVVPEPAAEAAPTTPAVGPSAGGEAEPAPMAGTPNRVVAGG